MKRVVQLAAWLLVGLAASAAAAMPPPRALRSAEETRVACNVAGTWRGTGVDVDHTRWQFALALTQRETAVEGAFDWHGSDGHDGRERVVGRVDCGAHRLELRGVALENAPALALGRYDLALDQGFASFDGRWTGGIPGHMHGAR